MKYLQFILFFTLSVSSAFAQSPEKFNYQGVIRDNTNSPIVSQNVSLRFSIHESSASGTVVYQEDHVASTSAIGLVNLVVGDGTNPVGNLGSINWGADSYYLEVELDENGGTSYSSMGTAQLLSVPFALFANSSGSTDALPQATSGQTLRYNGSAWSANSSLYNNGNNIGIGTSTPLMKLHIEDQSGQGILGFNGIFIKTNSAFGGSSVWMQTDSDTAAAMVGLSGTGTETPNTLLLFQANANPIAFATDGLDRMTINGEGDVSVGHHQPEARLHVDGNTLFEGGDNVFNASVNNSEGNMGIGLDEFGNTLFSDYKLSVSSVSSGGVLKVHHNTGGQAAAFEGNVDVTGMLSKGGGTFKIDHPLDPENKFLYHSFVESPDMMNVYNGNVVTDDNGLAVVELPEYFEALNKDFRYQLTAIGGLFKVGVGKEISNNQFTIISEIPNAKVSWQVTGIRNDAFARENRIQVSVPKSEQEQGKYLHPEAFGKSREEMIRSGMPTESEKR